MPDDPLPLDLPLMRPLTTGLDPKERARDILLALTAWDFPWDIERSLEFALFRTYALPAVSGLLVKTGEFQTRTRKRYDDTELILSEILENGADHPRGKAALERMNAMHGRFRIANDDFLYVLSTFVFEPQRWIDRFGWRPLTDQERLAMFYYYRDIGQRMGMTDLPDRPETLERFNRDYEAAHFQKADSNAVIGTATLDLLLGFYMPRFLFPLGRPFARALMDPPLLQAMGFAPAPRVLQRLVPAVLRLRAAVLRILPRRRHPHRITQVKRPSYPNGYRIEELGTFAAKPPKQP